MAGPSPALKCVAYDEPTVPAVLDGAKLATCRMSTRAERRAKQRAATKAAKKKDQAHQRSPPSSDAAAVRREVARTAYTTTITEGENHILNAGDDVYSAELLVFRDRTRAFVALRRPTLQQVVEIDGYMKTVQASVAAQGAKAQQRWRMARGALSHATEPRQISSLSVKAEQAKQRVLRFNTEVIAFNRMRDEVYAHPAHREAMEYTKREFVTNVDGSLTRRETLEEDKQISDFDALLSEMKKEGGLAGAGQQEEEQAEVETAAALRAQRPAARMEALIPALEEPPDLGQELDSQPQPQTPELEPQPEPEPVNGDVARTSLGAAHSSRAQIAHVALDAKDQEYYAATKGFEERCRAYMELEHPTVAKVVEIDTYMKKVQAALALQGARGQKKWQMATAALPHATDARQIARLTATAEEARRRVEKYNMDVVKFNNFRDHLYSSEAHKQVMEMSKRMFPNNTTSK